MQVPGRRPDPFKQIDDPQPNQKAEHEAALAHFMARPTLVVDGPSPRVFIAVSVVDSPSEAHPDTEVTLVCAGPSEAEVRDGVRARYRNPNEDMYDRVPALWNTYLLSVPQHRPFDLVLGTIEAMAKKKETEHDGQG